MSSQAVLSTDKSEGMSGGRGMGGACGNIKVLSSTLFQHQSCISVEGRHALCMLGRTLISVTQVYRTISVALRFDTETSNPLDSTTS